MFNLPDNVKTITWSSTVHGRGHRLEETKVGCFLIDHIATGRSIVMTDSNVSKKVDQMIDKIKTGKSEFKLFNTLCKDDSDLKIYEFPTRTLKDAKQIEGQIRATIQPRYLLLN